MGKSVADYLESLQNDKANIIDAIQEQGVEVDDDATFTDLPNKIRSIESVKDYAALANKPKINNIELNGNMTLEALGIQPLGKYASLTSAMFEKSVGSNSTAGSNLPTNCFIGGISVGNALTNDASRYFVYRKGGTKNYTYMTSNSVGYDPIANVSSTDDYGMKLEVKTIAKATDKFPSTTGSKNVANFYLSHSGCVIAYSGSADATFTQNQIYRVVDTHNIQDLIIDALCNNKNVLTEEQKAKITAWLGLSEGIATLELDDDDYLIDGQDLDYDDGNEEVYGEGDR